MLNSTTLLSKLKSNYFSQSDITELKALQQKYPYFQIGSMLLSKALLKNKDAAYKTTLAKTAALVLDRDVLFKFLYKDILNTPTKPRISPTPATTVAKEKTTVKPEVKAPISDIKSVSKPEGPKPILSAKGDEIKDKKEMMKEVVGKLSLRQAQDDEINVKKKVERVEKKVEVKVEKEVILRQAQDDEVEVEKAKVEEKKEPKKSIEKEAKSSVKKVAKKSDVKVAKEKAPAKTTKKVTKASSTASSKKPISKTAKKSTAKPRVKKIKPVDRTTSIAIMEKFISEDPSINRPEDKAYEKELKLAKSSVAEEYNIVSETMAKLYSAQGNKKKAKKIYEKLSLIYPEKNTYFAARISEL
ncbi:MAG: hypothetical protein B6I18_07195 [Bacteroidetes bacterium 4572_112]|nr:MAG: hypothetical protein B6I18_07195 [Bacteroidetes bacterium 4572_112]